MRSPQFRGSDPEASCRKPAIVQANKQTKHCSTIQEIQQREDAARGALWVARIQRACRRHTPNRSQKSVCNNIDLSDTVHSDHTLTDPTASGLINNRQKHNADLVGETIRSASTSFWPGFNRPAINRAQAHKQTAKPSATRSHLEPLPSVRSPPITQCRPPGAARLEC